MMFAETYVEGLRAQISAVPAYAGIEKHRLPPSNDDAEFPILNVTWTADAGPVRGGARTGMPRFDHTTTLVIEVIERANDGPELRSKLSTHGQALMGVIMNNVSWGGSVLEGIAAVHHQVDLPIEGNYQIGRLQIRIEAVSSSTWGETTPADAFDGMDISSPDGAFDGLTSVIDIPT